MATVSLSSASGKWIMVSAIMASAMAFIDATALNVVLPSIQQSLHANATDLFWILNAYLLMLAALILIGGSLGDKLGRKKIFMTGILIFIGGSAACGISADVLQLIIFRVIQGIGGSLMIPGSLSLISSSIHEKERGKAIGTWSAFTTVVTIGGPVLGGALADAGYWRYIFFINVPIGLAALCFLWWKVKESSDENLDHNLDFSGALAIMLGLGLFTFGFLRVPALGWQHWQVISALVAGGVLMVVFMLIERKSKHPMMPLTLFTNLTFTGANLLTFFLYAGLGAAMLFMSLNFVQVQGYDQLQSGLTFLPFTILMVGIARFAGNLADKYGPRFLLITGPALAGVGLLILSFVKQTAGPSAYFTTFFPGVLIFGLGMSLTVAPLTAAVMGAVSDQYSGTASGVNNALSRIAGVFANAIFGAVAVLFFSGALKQEIKAVPLSNNAQQEVLAQAVELGNAKPPASLNKEEQQRVTTAYHNSFISAYGKIMRISALLGFLGALMAFVFIRNVKVKKTQAATAG
ncbi:MFS transporter [Chitinophaga agrisoli]|uniref:MFS transporter n=1 Tax=Chitinophaga agrisoli TaxID=2607653 RepID=A0A5B2VXL5_9BACT|nr:MFS transporter [Chitinophaga agrisoli]KAA2243554.1 MFS transporter [Chitinophaga agrisoli]